MGNLQLLWTYKGVFCLYSLLTAGGNRIIRSSRKIPTKIVELDYHGDAILDCTTVINGTKVNINWTKDGVAAPFGFRDKVPIIGATCERAGNYTCFGRAKNSMVVILKRFVVRVSAPPTPEDDSICGKGGEDLVQEGEICTVPTISDYPCCKYLIPPPQRLRLRSKLSNKIKNKCDLGAARNATPWKIDVTWNLTPNATLIWGWHVELMGLDNFLGIRSCVQINSKDKLLNWTFDDLHFGGTYEIKVEALPSDYKNFMVKKIVLPKRTDFCTSIGQECHWEICFPVNNLKQQKKTSILTWSRSRYHKTWSNFEIFYNSSDTNCKDTGSRKVKNATRLNLEIDKCPSYYVKVRPIFADGEGIFSKPIVFHPPENDEHREPENHIKVIVSCSIAVGVLMVVTFAILFVIRKRKPPADPLIAQDANVIENVASQQDKTKVFIVHDDHCETCKNVTHSLGNLLDKTGYVDCVLDFCRTKEINKRGLGWYESMIKSCDKIIIVCTKNGKRKYEQRQDGPYNFILKMLLGQMIHYQNRRLKIIPVYLDISSNEDVPLFLSEYKCYSLPSNVQDLCSALRLENNVNGDPSSDDACTEMAQDINNLKCTIDVMAKNHKGYKKSNRNLTSVV